MEKIIKDNWYTIMTIGIIVVIVCFCYSIILSPLELRGGVYKRLQETAYMYNHQHNIISGKIETIEEKISEIYYLLKHQELD